VLVQEVFATELKENETQLDGDGKHEDESIT
jgi:hypothetical protein